MKYGVHRLTWGQYFDPDNLGRFFRQVRETGADTVEFRPPDPAITGDMQSIKDIRKLAEDQGVELLFCFGYPKGLDMRSSDMYSRHYAVEHLKRAVAAAGNLGGTEIGGVLYSNWPTDYNKDMLTKQIKYDRTQRSIECIRQVIPTAESYNIQINLEILNRFEDYIINTVEEGLDMIRQVDSDRCGLLLDVFHMNIEEDDMAAAIRSAKGHIGQFHVSEPNRQIPYHNTRINWPEIGQALKSADYDKTVTIEAVVAFDDAASYNLRLWRDLITDTSVDARIQAMKAGIEFLKKSFTDAKE